MGGVNLKSCTHTLISLCIFFGIFKGNIPFSLYVASKNQFKCISKVIRCAKMYVQYIGRLEAWIKLDSYIFSYSSFGKLVCVCVFIWALKKALPCFMYFLWCFHLILALPNKAFKMWNESSKYEKRLCVRCHLVDQTIHKSLSIHFPSEFFHT